MKTLAVVLVVGALVPGSVLATGSSSTPAASAASPNWPNWVVAQAAPAAPSPPAAPAAAKPTGQTAATVITARGTVEAVDAQKQTVTIKGPKRTLVLQVRDPKKLEAIKVGDPVIAKYYEAVAFEVKKSGTAAPGVTVQQGTVSSKPGETPAGVVGQQITVTVTIVAIDRKAHTVTMKGPEGNSETVKARDPKNLEALKVGDLVEITYTRALAIGLDKSGK